MINASHTAILIITMSLVTIILRFLPFLIFSDKKKIPQIILYLGDVLPSATIGMLVIFCLKDINLKVVPYGLRELLAGLVVVLLQVLKRNTILSIVVGTASYMFLLFII